MSRDSDNRCWGSKLDDIMNMTITKSREVIARGVKWLFLKAMLGTARRLVETLYITEVHCFSGWVNIVRIIIAVWEEQVHSVQFILP